MEEQTNDKLSLLDTRQDSGGEGNGNTLWYSCLEHSMNRGAWWPKVHGVTKSWICWHNTQTRFLESEGSFPLIGI